MLHPIYLLPTLYIYYPPCISKLIWHVIGPQYDKVSEYTIYGASLIYVWDKRM